MYIRLQRHVRLLCSERRLLSTNRTVFLFWKHFVSTHAMSDHSIIVGLRNRWTVRNSIGCSRLKTPTGLNPSGRILLGAICTTAGGHHKDETIKIIEAKNVRPSAPYCRATRYRTFETVAHAHLSEHAVSGQSDNAASCVIRTDPDPFKLL